MNRRKWMQMAMGALPATMLSERHLNAQQQAARATRGLSSPLIKDVQVIATAPAWVVPAGGCGSRSAPRRRPRGPDAPDGGAR